MGDSHISRAESEELVQIDHRGFLHLGDRYQIRSQLGRGGMGEVWQAPKRESPETATPAGEAGVAERSVEAKRYRTA
jgi:hypothetical protein